MVTDNKTQPQTPSGAPATPPKKLGTTQTIAGVPCDDYEMQDSLKTRFCASNTMGKFVFPNLGALGGAGGGRRGGGGGGLLGGLSVPGWATGLSGSGFPLKVWTPDGKVQMEVTAVEKKAMPDDIFVIPDSYVDLSTMMGGFRGAGGGGGR
jgi:hypothetical protein